MPETNYWAGVDTLSEYKANTQNTEYSTTFGVPKLEATLRHARDILLESGFDQATIDRLYAPYEDPARPTPAHPMEIIRIHEALRGRLDEEDLTALDEAFKIQQTIKNEGGELGPFELSQMHGVLRDIGRNAPGILKGLAEVRSFWGRTKRNLAEGVADIITQPDISLGLATLDIANWSIAKAKIWAAPKHRRAELKARLLPELKLHSAPDKTFHTGTSAALHLMGQRLYGGLEFAAGMPLIYIGSQYNAPGITEIGKTTSARGMERFSAAREEAPHLVATLGEIVPWSEVTAESEEALLDEWKYWDDIGGWGKVAMYLRAGTDALAEIFVDPQYIFSGVPVAAVRGARKLTPLGRRLARAEETARFTRGFDQIGEAKVTAKTYLEETEKALKKSNEAIGAELGADVVDKHAFRRHMIAQRHKWNVDKLAEQRIAEQQAYREPFFMDPPRRNPGVVPTAEEMALKYELSKEVAKDLTDARIRTMKVGPDDITDWGEIEEVAFQHRWLLGPDDSEQIGKALNTMVHTGGLGIDDVTFTPLSPAYRNIPQYQVPVPKFEKYDLGGVTDKIEKVLLAEGKISADDYLARSLVRKETVARKNLGAARSAGDKPAIQFYEEGIKTLQKLRAEANLRKYPNYKEHFDESWLPGIMEGPLDSPSRFHRWMEATGDHLTRSLTPGGYWRYNPVIRAVTAPYRGLANIIRPNREPQRLLGAYAPDVWIKVRDWDLARTQHMRAYKEELTRIFEEAGVAKKRSEFNPAKHFSMLKRDKDRSRQLFKLLDTDPDIEVFAEMYKAADPQLQKAHDKIRAILDNFADKLELPREKRISGYAPHFWDQTWFHGGARPPEFDGMSINARVFFGALEERKGAPGYVEDIVAAMDYYGRGAFKKIYSEPMQQEILQAGEDLAKSTGRPVFQDYMNAWVADLKGKPTAFGRVIDRAFENHLDDILAGKKSWKPSKEDRIIAGLTGMMWAGALVGNPRYPLMQIGTGLITTSSRYGMFRTTRALFEMATPEGQALARKIGVAESFEKIYESPAFRSITDDLSKLGIQQTEFFIRGVSALAAVDVYLNKFGFATWDDAVRAGAHRTIMFESLRSAEEVNHLFGPLGRPAYLQRHLGLLSGRWMGTAATQFLSFMPKQTEELLAQFRSNPGKLVQHLMLAGWMSRVAAKELGIDVSNYVGLGYLPRQLDEVTAPAVDNVAAFVQMCASAGMGDRTQTQKYAEKWITAAELTLPMMGAFKTASRNAQRILDRQVENYRGEKVRNIDLGLDTRGKIFGPEVFSLALGQQSFRDVQYREAERAKRDYLDKQFFEANNLLRDIGDAFSDGELSKMTELEHRLISEYGVELVGETAIARAQEARMLGDALRDLKYSGKNRRRFMEIFNQYKIPIEP